MALFYFTYIYISCVCKYSAICTAIFGHSRKLIVLIMETFPLWKMVTKLRIELNVFDSVLFICRVRSCSHFSLGIVGISTEEPLPIFLVSSSGHIYTQNILSVVSWGYVHSWFWQLGAFCCYLLSPSLVFLAHLVLYTQNSTKTISCPQVCLLLPVKHRRQYIWVSEGPQYSFCFGKQLLLLKLRPICLE